MDLILTTGGKGCYTNEEWHFNSLNGITERREGTADKNEVQGNEGAVELRCKESSQKVNV